MSTVLLALLASMSVNAGMADSTLPDPVGEPTREATVVFTGDTLIHGSLTAAAQRNGDPYDFRPMFVGVRHLISQADLAICHLEVPLSPTSSALSSYPLFNAPREVADALSWAGYDGCSTASNHSYDRGEEGVLGTLGVLDEAGIGQNGMAGDPLTAQEATLYEVGDLHLAHISATYWLNGLRLPDDKPWLTRSLEPDSLIQTAQRAKAAGADLVVVSMHCCVEYRRQPTSTQLEVAHTLIASPHVDLVVTHHSHLVGPVERVGDEFVIHGLGNFLSGQLQSTSLREGVMAFARAVEVHGRWQFDSVEVVPTLVDRGTYRVDPSEGASLDRTMEAVNSMNTSIGIYELPGLSAEQLSLIE